MKYVSMRELIDLCTDQDDIIYELREENARLLNQLHEANNIITHAVFDSRDSQDIAYDYLAKNGLIKVEK